MVSEEAFVTSLTSLKEIRGDTMEAKVESSNNDMPILDVTYYFDWRRKMKAYLKKFGVWEIVINPPAPSNKKANLSSSLPIRV